MTLGFLAIFTALAFSMNATPNTSATEGANMGRDEIPRLQEAAEMEGAWRLGPLGGAPCDVRLTIEEVGFTGPDAPAWRFHGDADCLSGLGVGEVAAWRPGSDGVSLLRADGSIVAFLSRRGRMYEGKEPGNRLLQLTRP